MSLKTPLVLTVRSKDKVGYSLQSEGTATISYCFPEALQLNEPHAAKLLYVHGVKKPVFVNASFVELQGFNSDPVMLLGTSIQGSNVYVPVRSNYVSAVGGLTLANMDGSPINYTGNISLAIHLVPQASINTYQQ